MMNIPLINPFNRKQLKVKDSHLEDEEGNIFPLVEGAYRIVPKENYTSSFGFQWNRFRKTQIDKYSGFNLSRDRFFAATEWNTLDLQDKNILEAGCGAGRFTQIALDYTKGNIYSFDYSDSVSANFKNNGPHERLNLFQASIYEMPFYPDSFDKVFCFGVLQFTPDFKKSIKCLVEVLKPGGELVIDYFPVRGWWTKISAKYMFRPITQRISNERLLKIISRYSGPMIKGYYFFDKIGLGKIVNRFLPICDIKHTLPYGLSKDKLREWVILDTFNMLSPQYENPQPVNNVVKWLKEFGMINIKAEVKTYGGKNSVNVVKAVKGEF